MPVRPDMVGMIAADMRATLDFYRQLGLPIPDGAHEDENGTPQHHVEVTVAGYRLAWDSVELVRRLDPDWVEPTGQRMGMAFLTDSPAEVDEVYARLVALGYEGHTAPYDAFWGQRYAVVKDPDGRNVDLFCPQ